MISLRMPLEIIIIVYGERVEQSVKSASAFLCSFAFVVSFGSCFCGAIERSSMAFKRQYAESLSIMVILMESR